MPDKKSYKVQRKTYKSTNQKKNSQDTTSKIHINHEKWKNIDTKMENQKPADESSNFIKKQFNDITHQQTGYIQKPQGVLDNGLQLINKDELNDYHDISNNIHRTTNNGLIQHVEFKEKKPEIINNNEETSTKLINPNENNIFNNMMNNKATIKNYQSKSAQNALKKHDNHEKDSSSNSFDKFSFEKKDIQRDFILLHNNTRANISNRMINFDNISNNFTFDKRVDVSKMFAATPKNSNINESFDDLTSSIYNIPKINNIQTEQFSPMLRALGNFKASLIHQHRNALENIRRAQLKQIIDNQKKYGKSLNSQQKNPTNQKKQKEKIKRTKNNKKKQHGINTKSSQIKKNENKFFNYIPKSMKSYASNKKIIISDGRNTGESKN